MFELWVVGIILSIIIVLGYRPLTMELKLRKEEKEMNELENKRRRNSIG